MRTVTLTFAEIVRLIKASFYVTLGAAAVIVLLRLAVTSSSSQTSFVALAFQSISMALLFTTALFGLLANRPWKFKRLASWLGRPSIHGIWAGTLYTDWQDKEGNRPAPIPIAFVIRQTYLFVSIQSFTQRQPAHSTFEFLGTDEKTTDTHLAYVYELRRTAYKENKLTTGYGHLTLQDGGKVLAGDYWTNSPTQGRLELEFIAQDCDGVNSYDSVMRVIAQTKRQKVGAAT
ncbi:hypothetical protein BEN78_14780 [Xanthomonas citri pv. mangiferaeindicae]|nr:hypothetical protein BEN78_14780 [Xanthomonas citri pv. mangiferaeindicae]